MKRNFNIIKNLEVPESWVENAVNIPQTAPKRKMDFKTLSDWNSGKLGLRGGFKYYNFCS